MLRASLSLLIRGKSKINSPAIQVCFSSSSGSDKFSELKNNGKSSPDSKARVISVPKPKGYQNILKTQNKHPEQKPVVSIEKAAALAAEWIGGDVNEIKETLIEKYQTSTDIQNVSYVIISTF